MCKSAAGSSVLRTAQNETASCIVDINMCIRPNYGDVITKKSTLFISGKTEPGGSMLKIYKKVLFFSKENR